MSNPNNIIDAGIGIVAADKNDNSKFISVFIKEHLPFFEGEISSDYVDIERKSKDANGKEFKVTLQRGMAVKAEWLGAGNRLNAPNVRKGEEVKLSEVSGTDKFYWEEIGKSNQLRRKEKVTYGWSASKTPVESNEPPSSKNHYTATVDTENGHITVATSQANGEKSAFTFQINGKDGNATLTDNFGNMLQIDSAGKTISAKNKEGSFVQLTGKNGYVSTAELINLKSKKIVLDCETLQVTGDTTFDKTTKVKGTSEFVGNVKTKTIDFDTINGKVVNAPRLNGWDND